MKYVLEGLELDRHLPPKVVKSGSAVDPYQFGVILLKYEKVESEVWGIAVASQYI